MTVYCRAEYCTRIVGVRERTVLEERHVPPGSELRVELDAIIEDFVAGRLKPKNILIPRHYDAERHAMYESRKEAGSLVREWRPVTAADVLAVKYYGEGLALESSQAAGPAAPLVRLTLSDGCRLEFEVPAPLPEPEAEEEAAPAAVPAARRRRRH